MITQLQKHQSSKIFQSRWYHLKLNIMVRWTWCWSRTEELLKNRLIRIISLSRFFQFRKYIKQVQIKVSIKIRSNLSTFLIWCRRIKKSMGLLKLKRKEVVEEALMTIFLRNYLNWIKVVCGDIFFIIYNIKY